MAQEMNEYRYVILRNGESLEYYNKSAFNHRGFSSEEIQQHLQKNDVLVDMIDDLKYDVNIEYNPTRLFMAWRDEYNNISLKNYNFLKTPLCADDNDDFRNKINNLIMRYKNLIDCKIAIKYNEKVKKEVHDICDGILNAFQCGISGNISEMDELINGIISNHIKDEFWVSDLEHSYAFRGVSYYEELHSKCSEEIYEKSIKDELSFFRAVSEDKETVEITRMLNCPYKYLSNADAGRFSKEGVSCIYLGTTSLVCVNEIVDFNDFENDNNVFVSAFRFNDKGNKLKILNLATSNYLNLYDPRIGYDSQYRKELMISFIKLYPLIMATSFVVKDHSNNKVKYEYLISQSLMRTLKINGIDGVAYTSRKINNSNFAFPNNVNLAIISDDVSEDNEYGSLKKYFSMTQPVKINEIDTEKCTLINQVFANSQSVSNLEANNYKDISFEKLDDFLKSQEHIEGTSIQ